MKKILFSILVLFMTNSSLKSQENQFSPFKPPVSYEQTGIIADSILATLSLEEKASLIGGKKLFYINGIPEKNLPELYLADATQGVNIRKYVSNQLKKSTAFPAPILLASTWNPDLAREYARSVGEQCRAGGVAVLLGPGVNMYRNSQCGRNFEYFGEDPYLASRMVENYIVGVQSTGTIASIKHFLANNTEYFRRTSNSVVDKRTLHEIYLPVFQAGIDAGVMSVMTSYNLLNGEWTGQSHEVITRLLKEQMGFKWFVMTDWWSVYDPVKVIKSGQDLEMPGKGIFFFKDLRRMGDIYVKTNALRLVKEGVVNEEDIDRMARNIIRTYVAMGLLQRPVRDTQYLKNFSQHEQIALQTAREGIVLLKNDRNVLPFTPGNGKKILLCGDYAKKLARGLGAAAVDGYNIVQMNKAFEQFYGSEIKYVKRPSKKQVEQADLVLLSIGTMDSEAMDKVNTFPEKVEKQILEMAALNPNVVVIVNSGGGMNMTAWKDKVAAIVYSWYVGQNGNIALAEIISGKVNPSGRLPITIEKCFEDSPAFQSLPPGHEIYSGWRNDFRLSVPIHDVHYREGVFMGYRWYDAKNIEPAFHFGHGLSYTSFEYSNMQVSSKEFSKEDYLDVTFTLKNTGSMAGYETAQLYIQEVQPSVDRPQKELKGFTKTLLQPGESKTITIRLSVRDFSFWDVESHDWKANSGYFRILVGASSNDIRLQEDVVLN